MSSSLHKVMVSGHEHNPDVTSSHASSADGLQQSRVALDNCKGIPKSSHEALLFQLKTGQDALAAQLEVLTAVLENQNEMLKTIAAERTKPVQAMRQLTTKAADARRIPLDGRDKIPELVLSSTYTTDFNKWRNALYAHVGAHPSAIDHLRSEEHDSSETEARTANYDVELDRELAKLVYESIDDLIQERIEVVPWTGSALMQEVLAQYHQYNRHVHL
ncbi:hypothetical protein OC842_003883 [Tilletia horrida]|uniref:Uncharacterized protein n=1 Tax=Tilletia horrida TaxID=155126 RepID=A0AAN6JK18_9BASI|nr:hypothetical protein OC842_003883 [Tilletia horrida]